MKTSEKRTVTLSHKELTEAVFNFVAASVEEDDVEDFWGGDTRKIEFTLVYSDGFAGLSEPRATFSWTRLLTEPWPSG